MTLNIIRSERGFSLEFRKSDGKYLIHEGLDSEGSSQATWGTFPSLASAVDAFDILLHDPNSDAAAALPC